MDIGIIKNVQILYCAQLVHYIPEAIQENLLISSSTAKKVSARIDLLKAAQFIAESWRRVSTKTIHNRFPAVVSNTQTWRCRIRSMVKMRSYWKCTTLEITENFHAWTIVFIVIKKMKTVRNC
jgi:hypothetical protein